MHDMDVVDNVSVDAICVLRVVTPERAAASEADLGRHHGSDAEKLGRESGREESSERKDSAVGDVAWPKRKKENRENRTEIEAVVVFVVLKFFDRG